MDLNVDTKNLELSLDEQLSKNLLIERENIDQRRYPMRGDYHEEGVYTRGWNAGISALLSVIGSTPNSIEVSRAVGEVLQEAGEAIRNWPPYNSAHEGYGVIAEEFRELEEWVFMKQKNRDPEKMRKEARQLAAVAIRFMVEVCNEETVRK